jgi:hypothetical protein
MKKDANFDLSVALPHIGRVIATVLICSLVVYLIVALLLRSIYLRRLLRQDSVLLELTPPATNDKSALANQELINILHGLGMQRSVKERLLRLPLTISLELVGSFEQGIRFVIRVPKQEAETVERQINSFESTVRVSRVDDPFAAQIDSGKVHLQSFKQTGHYAFPLKTQELLERSDPGDYIAGALTQLQSGEIMCLQMLITPTVLKNASLISQKAIRNEDLLGHLSGRSYSGSGKVLHLINKLLFGILDTLGEVNHSSTRPSVAASSAQRNAQYESDVAKKRKPARTLSYFEQELVQSIQTKVRQPLFRTSIRSLVVTDSPEATKQRSRDMQASLASFSVPQYQSLKPRGMFHYGLKTKYRLYSFQHRLPELRSRKSAVLASSEVAGLFHFPHRAAGQTENLVTSLARTLPAPLSLKNATDLDVIIGMNHHHGQQTPIGLTTAERERHVYIIGGTGNGKTTMLQYAFIQDMHNGKGLALIDPHGDMAEAMLRYVPEHRLKDVIYFNPDDLDHPMGLNILELTSGLTGTELRREKNKITESIVSVFRKLFSEDDSGGHRIEYVLRNAVYTALTIEGATLFTVLKLIQNATYRKKITDKLEDEDLKDFWKSELGQAGNMQRVKMSAGVTNKIGRFRSSAAAHLVLGQKKSTLDLDDIINSGKILICNFSKGPLGEDVSELFGVMVLAKLQLASLQRQRVARDNRRPFYLYVDEFQNFATVSFTQMLSESRKYKLYILMAEQSTAQQHDQQMVQIIMSNVGSFICFKTSSPADEQMFLPLFEPYITKGEISNLSSFNFYAKLSAITSREPLSGTTLLLDDEGSEAVAQQVIELSRATYGCPAELLEDSPDTIPVVESKPAKPEAKPKDAKKKPSKKKKTSPKDQSGHDELPEDT